MSDEQTKFQLRCSAAQKARWQEAAGTGNLSEWIRGILDAAIEHGHPANLAREVEIERRHRHQAEEIAAGVAAPIEQPEDALPPGIEEEERVFPTPRDPEEYQALMDRLVEKTGESFDDLSHEYESTDHPFNDFVAWLQWRALPETKVDPVEAIEKFLAVADGVEYEFWQADPVGNPDYVLTANDEVPRLATAIELDVMSQGAENASAAMIEATTETDVQPGMLDFIPVDGGTRIVNNRDVPMLVNGFRLEPGEETFVADAAPHGDAKTGVFVEEVSAVDDMIVTPGAEWDDAPPEPEEPRETIPPPTFTPVPDPTPAQPLDTTCVNAQLHWRMAAGEVCRFCGGRA